MLHNWEGKKCEGVDVNLFFDRYEESTQVAKIIDNLCMSCVNQQKCLATGVSNSEWGVWGGVYLEGGKISKTHNKHKDQDAWFDVWVSATTES